MIPTCQGNKTKQNRCLNGGKGVCLKGSLSRGRDFLLVILNERKEKGCLKGSLSRGAGKGCLKGSFSSGRRNIYIVESLKPRREKSYPTAKVTK